MTSCRGLSFVCSSPSLRADFALQESIMSSMLYAYAELAAGIAKEVGHAPLGHRNLFSAFEVPI